MQEHLLEFSCFLQCCTQLGGGTSKDQGQAKKKLTIRMYLPGESTPALVVRSVVFSILVLVWLGLEEKISSAQSRKEDVQ
jgi:hypothetical protein